jgi:hypothetical protein
MAKRKPTGNTSGAPEVILEFLFDKGVLSLSVRNIGARAARKVAVSLADLGVLHNGP